jgi:hypothetical protein
MIKSLKEVIIHHSIILYHAYFQFPTKYGIIFWLTDSYIKNDFCLQKQVLRWIFGIKGCASFRNGFKAHMILTMASIYIL